jgi:hypothetical protein
MKGPFVWHEEMPEYDEPVLVVMLTGWIDASGAAAAAMAAFQIACDTQPILTFDGDTFIDYRARRPTMELRNGVNTRLVWPEIQLQAGRDAKGNDVLALVGPEPDMSWNRFAKLVGDLSSFLDVRAGVGLGAYPFAAPHTRPSRLSTSSPTEFGASLPYLRNSVDVPAGMGAAIEHALHAHEIPAVGLWAQVPHYLGQMSYPAASVALLDGLAVATGIEVDTTLLRTEATVQRERIDQLVAANREHQTMLEQLETLYDAVGDEADGGGAADGPGLGGGPIPSADELAAEFERFLRDQQNP